VPGGGAVHSIITGLMHRSNDMHSIVASALLAALLLETKERRLVPEPSEDLHHWPRRGQATLPAELENAIRAALNRPGRTEGVRKIAARFGAAPTTVQQISRPFEGASALA
jgi:hypothetical protein